VFKGGYQGHGFQYMQGTISLHKLAEWGQRADLSVILAPGAKPKSKNASRHAELLYA
jgi:hypothetical protein